MKVYLRTIRERRRMTQEALASKSGIAQNTISKLEGNPKSRPVFTTVVALATALGVDAVDLCFGPNPRRQPRRRAMPPRDGADDPKGVPV